MGEKFKFSKRRVISHLLLVIEPKIPSEIRQPLRQFGRCQTINPSPFLIFRMLMTKLTILPTLTRFFGSQRFTVLLHWPLWLSATQWFATKSGKVIYLWNSKEFELSTSTKTRYVCDMYILCKWCNLWCTLGFKELSSNDLI